MFNTIPGPGAVGSGAQKKQGIVGMKDDFQQKFKNFVKRIAKHAKRAVSFCIKKTKHAKPAVSQSTKFCKTAS
jgi:hypothetical protein